MIMTDTQLMLHAFQVSHPSSSSATSRSLLNGSAIDESAPLRTTPFPSSHHLSSTDLSPTFDPALCVTPERTVPVSSRVPLQCSVPSVLEDDAEPDHRATRVHFDHTVSVHHLSPDYSSNGASPDDCRLPELKTDSPYSTCSEFDTSDIEPISVIASDLRRFSPTSLSLLSEPDSSRVLQRSRSSATGKNISGDSAKKKKKSKTSSSISAVTIPDSSVHNCQNDELIIEAECTLAKPELNSTLKISHEIAQLQLQEFDLAAVTKEKISSKLKQQVYEKACLKVNPETVVYPNLISLEVSEADVLSRAADEQANRLRPSDAAADRLKPEDRISRAPDILDFFTADLQKESPSVNVVAIPPFQLAPQTAELDRAFDLYRHIRSWDD